MIGSDIFYQFFLSFTDPKSHFISVASFKTTRKLVLLILFLTGFSSSVQAWEPEYQYLGWSMRVSGRGQLHIDPDNSQILYYLDGVQGVYKSQDGGMTWKHKANGYQPEVIEYYANLQISPFNSNTLFLLARSVVNVAYNSSKGLYKSTDGGDSWEKVYSPVTDERFEFFWLHPYIPDFIIAAKTNDFDYDTYWSDDGGVTWNLCPDMKYRIAEKLVFISSVPGLIIAIFDTGLYYSMDDGRTWHDYNIPVPGRIRDLTVHPDDPSFMYAAVDNGDSQHKGVYVTFDYGLNWQLLKEMFFYVPCVRVDYRNGISIFTENWHSEDGGLTWYENPWVAWHVDSLSNYIIDPQKAGTVYKINSYGLAVSRDNGWTWEQLAFNDYMLNCVQTPSNPDIIYAVTLHSGVVKSVDGGRTWITRSHGIGLHEGGEYIRIDPENENILYYGGGYCQGLYKSLDAGETWFKTLTLPAMDLVIDPFNSSTLYAACYDKYSKYYGVLKSLDGGKSWNSTSWVFPDQESSLDMIKASPHIPNLIYLVGWRKDHGATYLWKSCDGGAVWSSIAVPLVSEDMQVVDIQPDPFEPGVLYLLRWHSGLLKSTDWGTTWIEGIDPDNRFSDKVYPCLFFDLSHPGSIIGISDSTTFYICDLYRTCEGGYRWKNVAKVFYFLMLGNEEPSAVYGLMPRYENRYDVTKVDMYKITFDNPSPVIEMAGYGRTSLTDNSGGTFQLLCDVSCPGCKEGYPEVELTYQDIPTGLYLNDDGMDGDETADDGRYAITLNIPGGVLNPASYNFGIVARNDDGTISDRWPRLQVN